MAADIVQANYEQLEAIARAFGKQAEAQLALQKAIRARVEPLRSGGWQGRGATSFFAELDGKVHPALDRLIAALREAQTVTLKMSEVIRLAEEDAARPFQGVEAVLGIMVGSPDGADAAGADAPAAPDEPGRTRFQRFIDTMLATAPIMKEIVLDKLIIGQLLEAINTLDFTFRFEERYQEIWQAQEAYDKAAETYGRDSPEFEAADEKLKETMYKLPLIGPLYETLIKMGEANPVY